MTLHPRLQNGTFSPLKPLHVTSWLAWVSFACIVITIFLLILDEEKVVAMDLVFIYSFGIFGNMYAWPKTIISKTQQGRMIHTFWCLATYYMIQFYNLDLRSKLISQEELYVPTSPKEIYSATQFAYFYAPPGSPYYHISATSVNLLMAKQMEHRSFFNHLGLIDLDLGIQLLQYGFDVIPLKHFLLAMSEGKLSGKTTLTT